FPRIGARIEGGFSTIFPAAVTEIDSTGQLAENNQVGSFNTLAFKGRIVYQGRESECGTYVCKQSQFFAHFQQSLLRSNGGLWIIVEPRVPDCTEENSVCGHTNLMRFLRIRIAHSINGGCPCQG